jgi:hypothetical protein
MNVSPITENEWKGLTLKEGIQKAESIGYVWRIVEENGKPLMVPYDNKSNRVNFRLRDDVIIAVYPG